MMNYNSMHLFIAHSSDNVVVGGHLLGHQVQDRLKDKHYTSVSKIVCFPNSIKGINLVAGNTCKETLHSSLNLFPARRQDARSHVTCQDRMKESEEKKLENLTSTKSDRVIHQSIPSITCTARFENVEFDRFCPKSIWPCSRCQCLLVVRQSKARQL